MYSCQKKELQLPFLLSDTQSQISFQGLFFLYFNFKITGIKKFTLLTCRSTTIINSNFFPFFWATHSVPFSSEHTVVWKRSLTLIFSGWIETTGKITLTRSIFKIVWNDAKCIFSNGKLYGKPPRIPSIMKLMFWITLNTVFSFRPVQTWIDTNGLIQFNKLPK